MNDFESKNEVKSVTPHNEDLFPDAELEAYRSKLIDQIHGNTVERDANYAGNYAELLFSRMSNPMIRGQLLNLLEANERWLAEHPEPKRILKRDIQTNEVVLSDDGLPLFEQVSGTYIPETREALDAELTKVLAHEMSVTAIDFKKTPSESGATLADPLGYMKGISARREAVIGIAPDDSKTSSFRDNIVPRMSMTEAHEKGHAFRNFKRSGYLEDMFSNAFDITSIDVEEYRKKALGDESTQSLSIDDIRKEASEYFSFDKPEELVERMSQLKNYFGFKADEVFTRKHLQYAREHYITDGHIDNHMRTFFEMITQEKEDAFIKLMNSIGI